MTETYSDTGDRFLLQRIGENVEGDGTLQNKWTIEGILNLLGNPNDPFFAEFSRSPTFSNTSFSPEHRRISSRHASLMRIDTSRRLANDGGRFF